jgi:hypothetical protein
MSRLPVGSSLFAHHDFELLNHGVSRYEQFIKVF